MMRKQLYGQWHTYARLLGGTLLIAALVFGVLFKNADASTQTQSGTVNVKATVPGPPPSIASTIDSPANGTSFTTNPINVRGSCPTDGLIIKIIDNGHFVGSAICEGGVFSVRVDLFVGQNTLVAQEFDSLDQQGPDSVPVNVSFGLPIAVPTTPSQLQIALNGQYKAYSSCLPGEQFNLPLTVNGGIAPYAVHIDWGDGASSLASISGASEPLLANHAYSKAGNYQIEVTASDGSGQQALLSIVVVIDGPPRSFPAAVGQVVQSAWHLKWYYQVLELTLVFGIGYALGKLGWRWAPSKKSTKKTKSKNMVLARRTH